jgi:TonB family protein
MRPLTRVALGVAAWVAVGGAFARHASAQTDTVRRELKEAPEPKLTKPPELITFVRAEYPAEARAAGIAGRVELEITIDAKGKVSQVKLLSAPSPQLAAAAEEAVKQFRFSPAEVDGKPAPVRLRYGYNFELELAFQPRLPQWMLDRPVARTDDAIAGQVREQGTRLPVPGAAVAIDALGIEVRADGRGRFAIPTVEPGTYEIAAFASTHKRDVAQIEVREGEQQQVKFYLEPTKEDAYVTVVRGKRRQTSVSRVTLRKRQLTTVPGTFGDPIRAIQNLPGLARTPFVGGALLIRGAAPQDSGTYLDGIRIPILFHFLGGPSVLNPEFLERIDYYPGNADARYNRLIAGAVDVTTRNTFTRQLKGSVDVNLLNTGVYLNVPITERVSVAGAIRRSYVDALLPPILDAAGQDATTVVPVYYDYQLRTDVDLRGDDALWILAFGSDDRLEVVSNEPDNDFAVELDTAILFHRVIGSWRKFFNGKKGVSRFSPFVGYNEISLSAGTAAVTISSWVAGARQDFELKLRKGIRLRTGLDILVQQSEFDANIPIPAPYRNPARPLGDGGQGGGGADLTTDETEPINVKQVLGSVAAYVDATIDLTPRLQLIPGLRFDVFFYQKNNVRPTLDPRLTLRYKLDEKTVLKGGAGIYSQAPAPEVSNDITGNPNLVLEHAAQFSLGVERQLFVPQLSLDLQAYLNYRYDNAVQTDEVLIGAESIRRLRAVSDAEGYSTGLEILLKHDVTRNFYGWLAYTLSWARQQREPDGDMLRFIFDQRHILTLVASYRFGNNWEFGARFRLVTGRPETTIDQGVFDDNAGIYQQVFGEELGASRATFHQLDLRIEKTWLFKLWRLSVYLDVQNVYNAENPEATVYDFRFRESGPIRGLPLLPTLGVKGAF